MLDMQPTVNDTCTITRITITAYAQAGMIRTDIAHTPEKTLDAHRNEVTVAARSFPVRVACPATAARTLYEGALARHPHAIVELINA